MAISALPSMSRSGALGAEMFMLSTMDLTRTHRGRKVPCGRSRFDFPNVADLPLHENHQNDCSRHEAENDPATAHAHDVVQERHVTLRSQISRDTKGYGPDSVKRSPRLHALQSRIEESKRCREAGCIRQQATRTILGGQHDFRPAMNP